MIQKAAQLKNYKLIVAVVNDIPTIIGHEICWKSNLAWQNYNEFM